MEWNEISFEGKRKLTRWHRKQVRNSNLVCMSKIVRDAKNESELFKTCGLITKQYNTRHKALASQMSSEVTPDISPENAT
ncbi:MAG: hypothetical protein A4E23_00185 [Methanomethylovorans sp. PtaU1.Bin073]|jgi:hypothetical protein|nr:MAG: hypothetical protein A4E23_00185 [Methanomethylovorans sp. PtaU1.Bin073]